MTIIEVAGQSNGAHRNQTASVLKIPSGWAACVPSELDNFPFGEILSTETRNGVVWVAEWQALEVPQVEAETTVEEILSVLLGVTE